MSFWQELANFSSLLHQLSSMGCTSDIHEVTLSLPSFSYVCILLTGIGEGVGYDPIPERVNEAVVFELGEPRGSSSGDKSVRSGLKKLFIINHQQYFVCQLYPKSFTQVSLMTDYVVVLTEKYDLLHLQLLDARQLIDKNHIVIERDKVEKVTVWR